MPRMRDFEIWFNRSADFENFRASEFIIRSTVGGVTNTVPPQNLWPNVLPLARVLQALREVVEHPIAITSGYRSPEYNAVVGGAEKSQHKEFRAADIVCNHVSVDYMYQCLMFFRRQNMFSGGLGKYSTFVHVDTRGKNVNWRTSR